MYKEGRTQKAKRQSDRALSRRAPFFSSVLSFPRLSCCRLVLFFFVVRLFFNGRSRVVFSRFTPPYGNGDGVAPTFTITGVGVRVLDTLTTTPETLLTAKHTSRVNPASTSYSATFSPRTSGNSAPTDLHNPTTIYRSPPYLKTTPPQST